MVFSGVDNKNIPLEVKLNNIFNKKRGFFIELGANDGLFQSNTAFLEKEMEWTGILIEPSPKGYELCIKNRPNSICLNFACVSDDYKENYVEGDFINNDSMASINGKRTNNKKLTKVRATTLEKIIHEHKCKNIDFLSLDTEGYEFNILKGLNLDKHRPNYMLIEIYNNDIERIFNLLYSKNYKLHSNFTNYNKIDNPRWDGTHNDYLFYDSTLINNYK